MSIRGVSGVLTIRFYMLLAERFKFKGPPHIQHPETEAALSIAEDPIILEFPSIGGPTYGFATPEPRKRRRSISNPF